MWGLVQAVKLEILKITKRLSRDGKKTRKKIKKEIVQLRFYRRLNTKDLRNWRATALCEEVN